MVAVLLVDVGFGDLHSTKDPAMDLYIIHMSKLILQSAKDLSINKIQDTTLVDKTSEIKKIADVTATSSTVIAGMAMGVLFPGIGTVASLAYGKQQKEKMDKEYEKKQKENSKILYTKICNEWNDKVNDNGKRCKCFGQEFFVIDDD